MRWTRMNSKDDYLQIARKAFREIQSRFLGLQLVEDPSVSVELNVNIPVQAGVIYPINLNLQNRDELHFSVGHFRLKWFPCSNEEALSAYIDTVSGFLAGRYRILEHYRGRRCVKAELQKEGPEGQWSTFGTYSRPSIPLPWRKRYRVLINQPQIEAHQTKPDDRQSSSSARGGPMNGPEHKNV
jgi:hypothetical protein